MPEFLGEGRPIATQDDYVPALTLGPATGVKQISLSVIAANPALIQAWRYTDRNRTKWELEAVERTIVGQSIGVVLQDCAGVQIRSAGAGAPTTVVGELAYDGDIVLIGGGVTSAQISSTGKTTTATQVDVQHNDSLVAAEGTLDFEDAGANAWTIVDDAPNTRVKITPPRIIAGSVNSDGTVDFGTGFTVAKTGTGAYTVTFANAFDAAPVFVANVATGGLTGGSVRIVSATATAVSVLTGDSSANADAAFHFIAFAA